jgi:hypothetical protein
MSGCGASASCASAHHLQRSSMAFGKDCATLVLWNSAIHETNAQKWAAPGRRS